MNKIISLNIAILTVSDTRNKNTDKSGKVIQNRITRSPHKVVQKYAFLTSILNTMCDFHDFGLTFFLHNVFLYF